MSLPHAGVATAWATYGYDGPYRITSVTTPAGATTTTYSGSLTTITDPASLQRRSRHDALGRLTLVEKNLNALFSQPVLTSTYGYDAADRLTSVTPGGQSRACGYDTMGWLRRATNPEVERHPVRHGGAAVVWPGVCDSGPPGLDAPGHGSGRRGDPAV